MKVSTERLSRIRQAREMIARENLEDSSESEIASEDEHSEDNKEIWRKRTRTCQRPRYLMMISSIV